MKERQILINAGMSVLQVFVVAVAYFGLYRFLLETIGAEQLGVWALVIGSASALQAASLGLPAGVVKYVVKYVSRNDHQIVSRLLQTTAIAVGSSLALVLLLVYFVAERVLRSFVADHALPDVMLILPFAMASIWLMVISSIVTGALDGYQRIDQRCGLQMGATTLYVALSVVLVKQAGLGLVGVAYASVAQYLILLIMGIFMLRRHVLLPLIPYQWDTALFKETLGYGVSFQIITITTMLFEPVTKALLALFGDLILVGYYEVATRVITQLRSLIVVVNNVLVPVIADLSERTPSRIKDVYVNAFSVSFFVSVPLYALLVVLAPVLSAVGIGYYQPFFVACIFCLTGGWLVNTLTAPAYFAYLGDGRLGWLVVSHIAMAGLNVALGWMLGARYGGAGVVIGWSLALLIGSLIWYIAYHIQKKCSFRILWANGNLVLLLSSGVAILFAAGLYRFAAPEASLLLQSGAVVGSFVLIMIVPLWSHPIRKRLQRWMVRQAVGATP